MCAEALLRLLRTTPAISSAVWPAAVTLRALVVESLDALKRVARPDGCAAVAKAMGACLDSPQAQEQLCRLVDEMAARDFTARAQLHDAGVLHFVRKAMFVHKAHSGLRLLANRAYASLGGGALGSVDEDPGEPEEQDEFDY